MVTVKIGKARHNFAKITGVVRNCYQFPMNTEAVDLDSSFYGLVETALTESRPHRDTESDSSSVLLPNLGQEGETTV